jgi:hypothetical protein
MTLVRATLVLSLFGLQTALAGPPFRTDDPVPVAFGHFELYTAAIGTHVKGDTSGGLPSVELTYGLIPSLRCPRLAFADAPALELRDAGHLCEHQLGCGVVGRGPWLGEALELDAALAEVRDDVEHVEGGTRQPVELGDV